MGSLTARSYRSGFIDKTEMQACLKRLGAKATAKEAARVLKVADLDGNGVLDFDEFLVAVSQSRPAGWNAIFVAEIPTVLEAINQVRSLRPCYAFTNTNPTHLAAWKSGYPAIFKSFDRIFISSDLGLRKPELRAFAAIADQIGTTCRDILFFDDTLENIEGAKKAGLQTVHVRSPADVQQALSLIAPTAAC